LLVFLESYHLNYQLEFLLILIQIGKLILKLQNNILLEKISLSLELSIILQIVLMKQLLVLFVD